MEPPHAGDFLPGIAHQLGVDRLLRFDHRVHAFGRYDRLALMHENKRRVLPVEHDHIDLVAELAFAISDASSSHGPPRQGPRTGSGDPGQSSPQSQDGLKALGRRRGT